MRERLKEFMDRKKVTAADLADRIGVQRSNVSHILNGRNYPGAQFLEKLLLAFPDLDANWLLTGRSRVVAGEVQGGSSHAEMKGLFASERGAGQEEAGLFSPGSGVRTGGAVPLLTAPVAPGSTVLPGEAAVPSAVPPSERTAAPLSAGAAATSLSAGAGAASLSAGAPSASSQPFPGHLQEGNPYRTPTGGVSLPADQKVALPLPADSIATATRIILFHADRTYTEYLPR